MKKMNKVTSQGSVSKHLEKNHNMKMFCMLSMKKNQIVLSCLQYKLKWSQDNDSMVQIKLPIKYYKFRKIMLKNIWEN